jgi:cellulose synthase/poly-beta-1,6-N-acetylglucosamine synthase-like glycosyltransferase
VEVQLDSLDSVIHVCLDGVEAHDLPRGSRVAVHGGGKDRTGIGAPLREVLATSQAEALLVLDAGDRLTPRALERLCTALMREDADAAYGMVVTPDGLLKSSLPFEPWRLHWSDYIATASLWRFSSLQQLGGWSEDPALDGAETWDLWRRLAASGGSAVLVPRPLVRQAFAQDPPASRYELDPAGVLEQLEQRVPALAAL